MLIPLDLDGLLNDPYENGKASQVRERFLADFTGWKNDHKKFEIRVVKAIGPAACPAGPPRRFAMIASS